MNIPHTVITIISTGITRCCLKEMKTGLLRACLNRTEEFMSKKGRICYIKLKKAPYHKNGENRKKNQSIIKTVTMKWNALTRLQSRDRDKFLHSLTH